MYLSLIHEGQSQGVKENLPELISKYPNDPGVLYLQALLTSNGIKSLEFYSKLIEKFPEPPVGEIVACPSQDPQLASTVKGTLLISLFSSI